MPHIQSAQANDDFTFESLKSTHEFTSQSQSTEPTVPNPVVTTTSPSPPVSPTYNIGDVENVANIKLWLPSDIPILVRHLVATAELVAAERELLLADLHNCLVAIHKHRRALSAISLDRRGNWQSPSPNAASAKQRERVTGIGIKVEQCRT
jgi:hypothetical protein